MDNAFDVPDHTDWLNTPLSGFADLENLLHCQICKDFYETPMITSCAHTFCSKCIRTSLSADGKCPLCTKPDQASKLRNNWAVQDIVASFIGTRPQALSVARRAQEEAAESKRPGKRKRGNAIDLDDVEDVQSEGRTTRSKARKLAASQSSQQESIAVVDSDTESQFEPEKPADDGLVECPLGCGKRMKIEAVEPHLDRCEDEKKRDQRSASRTPLAASGRSSHPPTNHQTRAEDRINELHYSGMKDTVMTKKLKDIGIPSWGSKQIMINRHREWVNLWNANCDSDRPRTKRELLQDLEIWERTQGGRAVNMNGLSKGPMRKDFDGGAHAKKHHDEFNRLIADAQRKKNNPAVKATEPKDVQTDAPLMSEDCHGAVEKANHISLASQLESGAGSPAPYDQDSTALAAMQSKVNVINDGHDPGPEMVDKEVETSAGDDGDIYPRYYPGNSTTNNEAPRTKVDSATSSLARQSDTLFSKPSTGAHDAHTRPLSAQSSPPKKLPMFAVQGNPVADVDGGGGNG